MRHTFGIGKATAIEVARAALTSSLPDGLLGATETVELEELTVGFANQNWRVHCADGEFVLKIGPTSSTAKWSAGAVGAQQAAELGLRVPELRWQGTVDDRVARLFRWIEGEPATTLLGRPDAQAKLGRQLATSIAVLHQRAETTAFTSRLDGSAEFFSSWAGYVEHRLNQIEARAEAAGAPERTLRVRATAICRSIATDVGAHCRPTLCHRDLHPDNLLVEADGSLVAVLDWDMPEVWDQAGEWFKLDRFLFAQLPAARESFESAYVAAYPPGTMWDERVRLVHMLENLNVIANTSSNDSAFVDASIDALRSLLG